MLSGETYQKSSIMLRMKKEELKIHHAWRNQKKAEVTEQNTC